MEGALRSGMQPYANRGGDSGVIGYEIGTNSIVVRFRDGWNYEYTYQSAGQGNIEHMQQLAIHGSGLNSFINTHVKKLYARKFR